MGEYRSKDGYLYGSQSEMLSSNQRYEQNNLLKEQNKLIREQNKLQEKKIQQSEDERRARENEEWRKKRIEAEERRLQAFSLQKSACLRALEDNIKKTYPLFADAGVKNPAAYVDKLEKLYPCNLIKDRDDGFITKLYISEVKEYNRDALFNAIHNEVLNATKTINNEINDGNSILSEETAKTLLEKLEAIASFESKMKDDIVEAENKSDRIVSRIILSIIFGIVTLLWLFNHIFYDNAFLSIVGAIIIVIVINHVISKNSKIQLAHNIDKGKKDLSELNQLINEYNELIQTKETEYTRYKQRDHEEREKRISKYEQKRIENFNVKLEYVLEILTSIYAKIFDGLAIIEKNYGILFLADEHPNFMLHHYAYPPEYELFKKRLMMTSAIEDGTEVFLDI